MAASQRATKAAATTQTKTRSRVLMRCGLGAGVDQGMERNYNGGNHHCYRDNEKGHSAYLTPHAISLALTEGEPALRPHNFPIEESGARPRLPAMGELQWKWLRPKWPLPSHT